MFSQKAYAQPRVVSQENIDHYRSDGFLIVPDLMTPEEILELRRETISIFRGKRGPVPGLVEVPQDEPDENVLKRYVAIHFPHKISPIIRALLSHPHIIDVLSRIVSPNLKCMQSMLFVKAPGKAGQSWHQDEYYIPTRDKSLTGVWIAIDDATLDNGCLWIIPRSNREGFIRKRVANENKDYADVDTADVSDYSESEKVPVEIKSGSAIFFNGYTLHSSLSNRTEDKFRSALVNHYMSSESMLPWDQDGKLPPTEDLRDICMVAGQDPYSYKGVIDVNRPYLRPEVLQIKA